MEQERDYQTVYFKDLLFAALYQWKAIIIAALICSLLLGGFAVLSNRTAASQPSPSLPSEVEEKAKQLKTTAELTEHYIANQTAYLKNSIFMQLDPYESYTAGFHISATLHSEEAVPEGNSSATVLRAYRSFLMGAEATGMIAEKCGIEAMYMAELITFDTTNAELLGVTVRGRSLTEAQDFSDVVLEVLQGQTDSINASVEPHTVTVVPFAAGPKIDTSVYDAQNLARQKLVTLQNNLTNTNKEISQLPTTTPPSHRSPLVFAVIGAMLGACLIAGIAFIRHIAGRKIYSQRVLKNMTGVKVLGCVPTAEQKNPVDRWLRKLEGRSMDPGQLDVVISAIQNLCTTGSNILVLGQSTNEERSPVLEALKKIGIRCMDRGSLLDATDGFAAMPECTAIILVETCNRSSYESVLRTMELISDQKKPLLGCILLNG